MGFFCVILKSMIGTVIMTVSVSNSTSAVVDESVLYIEKMIPTANGRRENHPNQASTTEKLRCYCRLACNGHYQRCSRSPPYFSSFRFLMAPGEVPAVFPDKRPLSGHLILDNSIPCSCFFPIGSPPNAVKNGIT